MFKPLAIAAALLSTAPAFAAVVSITYAGKDAGVPVIGTSLGTDYAIGAMHYDLTGGNSFLAYCIEPEQTFAITSRGAKDYTIGSFSGNEATLLQGLYSSSFGQVNSSNQQAAFQLAVWEIMRETSGTLNVTTGSGSFYMTSTGNQAVQTLANGYLASALSYSGASLYTLTKLTNGTYQDLVTVAPLSAVPEPGSYALFLGGLGVIGLLARRRLPR